MRIVSLFALILFLVPVFAPAATLVNINTADLLTLETLPGVGPAIGKRIIDYRVKNGPFTKIEDIQKVSGIGSGASYKNIAPLITVSSPVTFVAPTSTTNPSTTSTSSTTSTTSTGSGQASSGQVGQVGGSGPPEYLPIPVLRMVTEGDRTVSSGADTPFTVVVYDGKGNKRNDVKVSWSFGDGMQRTGSSVFHTYYEPGDYLAIVHVSTSDGGDALKNIIITVKDASIKISSLSSRGIAISNNSQRELDLSFWRLSMGGKEFKIPENTNILAGRSIIFSSKITGLPLSEKANLLYPSGEVAAMYPVQIINPVTTLTESVKISPSLLPQKTSAQVAVVALSQTSLSSSNSINTEITESKDNKNDDRDKNNKSENSDRSDKSENSEKSGGIFSSGWFRGFIGVIALASTSLLFL